MSNPHNHLQALKQIKDEVLDMPKIEVDEFDLDKELEKIQGLTEPAPEEPEPEVSREQQLTDQIIAMLKNHPEAPTQEQIDAWKAKHGKHSVQVFALDPENVFVLTHLKLSQWEKLQSINERLQANPNANIEKVMKENVIRSAILWPKISDQFFQDCRAGLPDTLYQLILANSYFLSVQQAMALTTAL